MRRLFSLLPLLLTGAVAAQEAPPTQGPLAAPGTVPEGTIPPNTVAPLDPPGAPAASPAPATHQGLIPQGEQ